MLGVLALGLYLLTAGLLKCGAALVGRRIPTGPFLLFALLPLAFFFQDIALDGTHLPTDQTYLAAPAPGRTAVPRNPWLGDVVTQFLPWAVKVRETWRGGDLPLRDRWNGCGSALAAGGLPGAFSPLTWLGLLLPLPRAIGLAASVKLLVALTGMWLWLSEIRVSATSAVFGAVSFAFSFSIVPWIFFPQAAAVGLWPWVFFCVERLRDRGAARRAFALLVAVLAVWPLVGHIESVVSGAALLAVVFAVRWAAGDLPDAPRLILRAAVAGAASIGLAAFALLPHALAILASNRRALAEVPLYAGFFSWVPHGFIWPGWRTTFFPRAFGDGIASPMMSGSWAAFTEMSFGYVGIAGWALAMLVLRPGSRRSPVTVGLLAAIVVAHGTGLGAWPFAEIAGHLPLFRWMLPVRILSWAAFAGAAMAALELDRFVKDVRSARLACLIAATGVAGALAFLALDTHSRYYLKLGPPAGFPAQVRALELVLSCVLAFFVSAVLVALAPERLRNAAACLWILVTGAELALQGARQYRVGRAAEVFPATPLVDFLRGQTGTFRVAGEQFALFPQKNAIVGVEDVRTHDPVERRDYVEFLNSTCGYAPADYFKTLTSVNEPALDFLNVRYLVSPPGRDIRSDRWKTVYSGPDGMIFENSFVLPRVFAPRRVIGVKGASTTGWIASARELFGDALPEVARIADFREKALVLDEADGERAGGEVEILDYRESANRATFRYRARGGTPETFLVTSLVQDGGWSARGRDRALATTLANGPFLAVRLPDGEGEVILDYTPPGWRPGLAVSTATLAALVGVLLLSRGSRRRERLRRLPWRSG